MIIANYSTVHGVQLRFLSEAQCRAICLSALECLNRPCITQALFFTRVPSPKLACTHLVMMYNLKG